MTEGLIKPNTIAAPPLEYYESLIITGELKPDSLQELYCSVNQITEIKNLPNSLHTFFGFGNQITKIPIKYQSLCGWYIFSC